MIARNQLVSILLRIVQEYLFTYSENFFACGTLKLFRLLVIRSARLLLLQLQLLASNPIAGAVSALAAMSQCVLVVAAAYL